MAYTAIPTYVTNQLITAAHGNTYWKENISTLFPYTTAGDIAYASSASVLARLAIGTAGQVLRVNSGASAPEWGESKGLSCYGYFSPINATGLTATTYTDISGATVDVVVPETATLFAIAMCTPYVPGNTETVYLRWVLDGTNQKEITIGFGSTLSGVTFCSINLLGLKSGVTAGTKTCKLQYHLSDGDTTSISAIYGFVIGFAE